MNPLLDLSAHPVIAHRGASAEAPENTLAAFERAASLGADAFELDVRLAADSVPVVMHDPSLERTTDRSGMVSALTSAQIQSSDAGAMFSSDGGRTFPWRGRGVRVPTLVEVLRAFPVMPILIEAKEAQVGDALRQVLLDEKATERCVIASELEAALAGFHVPPFVCGASGPDISRLYFGRFLGRAAGPVEFRLLSVPPRHHGLPIATRSFVAAARRLDCPVHVWTVDDPDFARVLWRRGVAGIVTNTPGRIRQARDEFNAAHT
ncbi:MAG: glycerophosphodiester phosphodiesterase family protein [Gemmatimonadota bacterium]